MATDVTRAELDERGTPEIVPLTDPPKDWEDKQFYLRAFDGNTRDRWDLWLSANSWTDDDAKAGRGRARTLKPGTPLTAQLVALTLCTKDGQTFYDPKDPAEVKTCGELDDDLLEWLFANAQRINGLGKQAEEDAAKNSDSDGSGAIGSGSPSCSDIKASVNANDG